MLSAMAHRPYPDRERALRQIMRRHRNELPPHLLPAARPLQGPVGAYVLSTRRLGVVSGGR
jgi:hypothetical protein